MAGNPERRNETASNYGKISAANPGLLEALASAVPAQQNDLGMSGLACLGLAALIWWASQPEYRVLYAGLSIEEAGAITTKLRSTAIPFKLAAGGTTILVPTEHALQAHLDLTAEGVAGSTKIGKGLEFFDQPMIGATPFTQSVNFLRTQQAELAKTIMQVDPIAYARVHIVRPDPSPFIREQKATTASVMVKLRPGATLSRNTVDGIGALVAGSVEGLSKDNVKIVDSTGRLLSRHQDGDLGGIGSIVDQKQRGRAVPGRGSGTDADGRAGAGPGGCRRAR